MTWLIPLSISGWLIPLIVSILINLVALILTPRGQLLVQKAARLVTRTSVISRDGFGGRRGLRRKVSPSLPIPPSPRPPQFVITGSPGPCGNYRPVYPVARTAPPPPPPPPTMVMF